MPRHEPGPPETLTDSDYANLLRAPDRRTIAGKRNYAALRVLGDCGLRSAELRGLRARDLRRPRANARQYRLYVHGKGGREREVPVPEAVQQALEAWGEGASARARSRLAHDQPLFVRLGRHCDEDPLPLSAVAVHRLVRRSCLAAGVQSGRRTHMRFGDWATHLPGGRPGARGLPRRLGHVDLRTTATLPRGLSGSMSRRGAPRSPPPGGATGRSGGVGR